MNINDIIEYFSDINGIKYNTIFANKIWDILSFDEDEKVFYIVAPGVIEHNFGVKENFYRVNNVFFVEKDEDASNNSFGIDVCIDGMKEWYKKRVKKKACNAILNKIEQIAENRKKHVEILENEYTRKKMELRDISEKLVLEKLSLVKDSSIEKLKKQTLEQIDDIINHKKVKEVTCDDDYLKITVQDIIITEPISERRFFIGEAIIDIPFNSVNSIIFSGTQNTKTAIGYWREEQVHPHVDSYGHPCLGNADAQLAEYINDGKYYAAFITALNFLQTCNVEDIAGYAVSNWNEILEDGTIILGHNPKPGEYGEGIIHFDEYDVTECAICMEEIEGGGVYYCDECNRTICGEHITLIEGVDRFICDDCLEEYYTQCDECGSWISKDEIIITGDEHHYCNNCVEHLTHVCEDCGEIFTEENMFYNEVTEQYYCKDCWEERKEAA